MQKVGWMCGLLLLLVLVCNGALAHSYSLMTTPQELADALALGNGIFVDLRSEKAFNRMHIPGFIHLPYDEKDVLALVEEDGPIYLICTSGITSAKAYNLLLDAGAQQVHAAIFGVEEYAEAMGLESMEGADICIPCILLQKSLEENNDQDTTVETAGEAVEITKEKYGEESV